MTVSKLNVWSYSFYPEALTLILNRLSEPVLQVFCVMYLGFSLVLQLLRTEFSFVFLFKFWPCKAST